MNRCVDRQTNGWTADIRMNQAMSEADGINCEFKALPKVLFPLCLKMIDYMTPLHCEPVLVNIVASNILSIF